MKKSSTFIFAWLVLCALGCSDTSIREKSNKGEPALAEPVSSKDLLRNSFTHSPNGLTKQAENTPKQHKEPDKANESPIVGKWGTVISLDGDAGYLYTTWNIQLNGIWKGSVYSDLAKSTNTFSTKWRLEGNNLYDVGETEDFLYVIKWLGNDKFKIVQTKGMVLNAVFERNFIFPPDGGGGGGGEHSMTCPRCNGSGYHACSLPPLSADDTKCRTPQEFANCMTTNNADKTQVTCCKCNGTGTWRY